MGGAWTSWGGVRVRTSEPSNIPGPPKPQEIVGHVGFRIMATMNPGGDFGKKELSPALRNRMTEIHVPSSMGIEEDLRVILREKLQGRDQFLPVLLDFIHFFTESESKGKRPLSVRDVVSWIEFVLRSEALGLTPEQVPASAAARVPGSAGRAAHSKPRRLSRSLLHSCVCP